jgi:hypothetical protein
LFDRLDQFVQWLISGGVPVWVVVAVAIVVALLLIRVT